MHPVVSRQYSGTQAALCFVQEYMRCFGGLSPVLSNIDHALRLHCASQGINFTQGNSSEHQQSLTIHCIHSVAIRMHV